VIAEGEATVVEVAEHTVACYAVGTVAMAGVDPATCEMEDIHVPGFERQEAFHLGPCPRVPYPVACQYSVDDDSSDQVGVGCAAEPSETGPCCSVGWTAGDNPEAPSADLVFVVSVRSCRTDYWAWPRL
jgi:hypothetical protein